MTLLQELLLHSLNTEPVLSSYIRTVLPAIEHEFGMVVLLNQGRPIQEQFSQRKIEFAVSADYYTIYSAPGLLVNLLNRLLVTWHMLCEIKSVFFPSEDEKRILCLGITLHHLFNERFGNTNKLLILEEDKTKIQQCIMIGMKLNFDRFWGDWRDYLSEIVYLAQDTYSYFESVTPLKQQVDFKIDYTRLSKLFCPLLAFGTVAAQLEAPVDILTKPEGALLQDILKLLGVKQRLVYHQIKASTGLLANSIHKIVVQQVESFNWQPVLYFAQGIIYLAPSDTEPPDRIELHKSLWNCVSKQLADNMLQGEAGFKRDGKGLKVSPQALELFTPEQLIRCLPVVIASYVKNEKDPATPKRLAKLDLNQKEREFLNQGADLRADRIAEFIILVQRKYFPACPEFDTWMLEKLEIESSITPEQTRRRSGGVNLGWYRAAAYYVANSPTCDSLIALRNLSEKLADWAEHNKLLPPHHSFVHTAFYDYLDQYLDIQGQNVQATSFQKELAGYVCARERLAAKQPICSLSSGEFPSDDQMDSVVLFKPQQYSNKNPLGGRQIKRGISKIWSLEMLLRQATWSVPAGKFEEQQPVFLYVYPATFYSPQIATAIYEAIDKIRCVNLWAIRKYWLAAGMDAGALRSFPWLKLSQKKSSVALDAAGFKTDLPFMILTYTTTKGKTVADAWVKPVFLALVLPLLLGVKVIATSSSVPPCNSGTEIQGVVQLEGASDFWNLLKLPPTLYYQTWINGRVQSLVEVLNRVLVVYSLHLEIRSDPPDARWNALLGTVRDISTDILNIFLLAKEGLRRNSAKQELTVEDIKRYWQYAEIWAEGDAVMQAKLKVTKKLVAEYCKFYRASPYESSHTILLPLSKALEHILTVPPDWDDEEIIEQGAGLLKEALDRQEIYKRPLLLDQSIDYTVRQLQEIEAIRAFMTTCVKQILGEMCGHDRALLQEQRNRIKAGVELAYRQQALQEKQIKANQKKGGKGECS